MTTCERSESLWIAYTRKAILQSSLLKRNSEQEFSQYSALLILNFELIYYFVYNVQVTLRHYLNFVVKTTFSKEFENTSKNILLLFRKAADGVLSATVLGKPKWSVIQVRFPEDVTFCNGRVATFRIKMFNWLQVKLNWDKFSLRSNERD